MVEADLDCVLSYYRLFSLILSERICLFAYVYCGKGSTSSGSGSTLDWTLRGMGGGGGGGGGALSQTPIGKRERERGIGLYVERAHSRRRRRGEGGAPPPRPHCCRGHEGPAVSFLCSGEEEEERDRGRVWYVLLLPENSTGGDGFNNVLKSLERFL